MLKRISALCGIYILMCTLVHGQSLQRYEHWIDNDVSQRTVVKSTAEDLAISVDLKALPEGVHYFNFRAQDSGNVWGALNRYLFFIPSRQSAVPSLSSYEYWIDNELTSRKSVKSSAEDVVVSYDITAMPTGVHYFNFRSLNSNGTYGALERYLFFIPSNENPNAQLVSYEYWIDNDFSAKTVKSGSDTEVAITYDISSLSTGVHYFNFRSRNSNGTYGSLERYLFFIPSFENPNTQLSSYEYWIDNDLSAKIVKSSSDTEVTITYDISSLPAGVHYFNFRSRNSNGTYGALERYLFFIPSLENPNAQLSKYEYWLDNDMDKKIMVNSSSEEELITIDLKDVANGVHYLNYRACNSNEKWGALQRFLFFKPDEVSTTPSPITGYEYSFGAKKETVKLEQTSVYEVSDMVIPIPSLAECSPIDNSCNFTFAADNVVMRRKTNLPFSMRFKNAGGKWGAPIVESIKMEDSISHKPEQLGVQKSVEFDKMTIGDYRVFHMTITETGSYYFKASQPCQIDLYNPNGTLYRTMYDTELLKIKQVGLFEGTYYGVVHSTRTNENYPAKNILVRLLLTEGYVPTPEIAFADGKASITCQQEGAKIYYTTDGKDPTTASTVYTAPFEVLTNLTIKAIATYEDLSPSDIVTFKVNCYKAEQPIIEFANLKLYMTCETPNSRIYYTTDGSDPTINGLLYTDPVAVSQNCTVKAVAKRNGYNDSDVAIYNVDVENVSCVAPTFSVKDNRLSINTLTEGATIYYTMDGTEPTTQSSVYKEPIILKQNGTVKAKVEKTGFIGSAVSTYVVDWLKADTPTFSLDNDLLTIGCATSGAVVYYTIGGETPNESSNKYVKPITLVDNKVVKAVAYADKLNVSEVAEFRPDFFACSPVEIKYNGRYATIEAKESNVTIYYTTDDSTPTKNSSVYAGKFDIGGLSTVKAFATKEGFNNGAVTTYTAAYYYNAEKVLTSSAGVLEKAFEWCGTDGIESLIVSGKINTSDIAFLSNIASLKYLDLESVNVEGNSIPNRAFAKSGIISISLPKSISNVGENIFAECSKIAAIQWNATTALSAEALKGIDNPNLLLYVKINSLAPSNVTNVIASDYAESIVLTDGNGGNTNFYCPRQFKAKKISYSHNYSMKTEVGVCAGWETIALPFDVQTISHSKNGEIAPFAANNMSAKPFWLYSLSYSGFEMADKIHANTPYIISMPNNDKYDDDYILSGEVTFKAENVNVPVTTHKVSSKGDLTFIPTTMSVDKNSNVYVINKNEEYNNHLPGSMFVGNLRDISPFEGYLSIASHLAKPRHISLTEIGFDNDITNGIAIPTKNDALKIWGAEGQIFVRALHPGTVNVCSVNGVLVRSVTLQSGVNVINNLISGVYIVGHKSIYVK